MSHKTSDWQTDVLKHYLPGDWTTPGAGQLKQERDHDHDPDNDRLYRRRRAWRDAKRAFGEGTDIGRSMLRIEALAGGSLVRLLFAAALDHFVSVPREQRLEILRGYFGRRDAREGKQPAGEPPPAQAPTTPADAPPRSDRPYGLKPFTVAVDDVTFEVVRSAKPLAEDADAHIDHTQRTIWLSPTLSERRAPRVVARALAQAWKERIDGPDLSTDDDPAEAWKRPKVEQRGSDPVQKAAPECPSEKDRETLPAGELDALAADLLAVQWKLYDTGWPMPANLPAEAEIKEPLVDGAPPRVMAGPTGFDSVCPHCGRVYRLSAWWARHLWREHGWRSDPRGNLLPPPRPGQGDQERRAA